MTESSLAQVTATEKPEEDLSSRTPAHGDKLLAPEHPLPAVRKHPMQCGLDMSGAKPLKAQMEQARLKPDDQGELVASPHAQE